MVHLWDHLVEMNDEILTKKVFLYDYSQCNTYSWCSEIKSLFEYMGLPPEFYQSMTRCDINSCEQTLSRKYNYEWSMQCAEMPKSRTYITFKTNYKTANYVKSYLSKQGRSFLAQLRFGVLPLRVETGRYRGLRPEQRTCQTGDSGDVENECHFILDCDKYTTERKVLYNKTDYQSFQTLNSPEKLKFLITNAYKHVLMKFHNVHDVY